MKTALEWFARYGYWAVFFPVMLELVGIPFPSETILLAAGATASLHKLNVWAVLGLGVAGAVIGSSLGYGIGHYGGRALLDRLVRRGLVKQHHLERVQGFFDRHGGKTLVFARFVPGVRIPAFWLAGVSAMPIPRFMTWNVAGAVVWVVTITLLGYVFANSVGTIEQLLGRDAFIGAGGLLLVAIGTFEVRRRLRDRA